jgi:hypothetical protein
MVGARGVRSWHIVPWRVCVPSASLGLQTTWVLTWHVTPSGRSGAVAWRPNPVWVDIGRVGALEDIVAAKAAHGAVAVRQSEVGLAH